MSNKLTHLDKTGKPSMVDVGNKEITLRTAIAEARVTLPSKVMKILRDSNFEMAKGPLIHTAVLAGIMGAKKTSDLVPLCHPLALDKVGIDIEVKKNEMIIRCEARISSKTGVEMEALTGASIAALTIYDMCKGLSHEIEIGPIKLLSKTGGKKDIG